MFLKRMAICALLSVCSLYAVKSSEKSAVTKELEELHKGKVSKVVISIQYPDKKTVTIDMDSATFVECVIASTTNDTDFYV